MKGHLDNKIIGNLAAGIATADEIRCAGEHMRSCTYCKKQVDLLTGILNTRETRDLPGEHVKAAVIDEWHRINRGEGAEVKQPLRYAWKFAPVFAAVLILTVAAYFTLLKGFQYPWTYSLAVTSVSGDAHVNSMPLVQNTLLQKGDMLRTGDDSAFSASTDGYTISVSESTEVVVEETRRETGLMFNLIRGEVVSSSEGDARYGFRCGVYKVIPTGTGFLLHYENERLVVSVMRGGVMVRGEGLEIELREGMQWDSDRPGDRDAAGLDHVESVRNDVRSGETNVEVKRNVDAVSAHGKTTAGKPGDAGIRKETDELRETAREMRGDIRDTRREMKQERSRNGRN